MNLQKHFEEQIELIASKAIRIIEETQSLPKLVQFAQNGFIYHVFI